MIKYSIQFRRSARKELAELDKTIRGRALNQIKQLGENPYPAGCRKLQGVDDLWRIRVGNYRVVYRIQKESLIIEIVLVRHRRDAYRFE